MERSRGAINEARRLAHPPSLAQSLGLATMLLSLGEDNTALDLCAGQLVAVTAEQGFAFYRAQGLICLGWAKVKDGDVPEGIPLLREGSAAYRTTGAQGWLPNYLALLARACVIAGQFREALAQFDDALRIAVRTGEGWFTAELNRHKGDLLLQQGSSEAAEALFRKALDIAVGQNAKLWELRAAKASPGCGANKASGPKHANCSPRSITGSPKGSTPPI